jgi:hypothetical protein
MVQKRRGHPKLANYANYNGKIFQFACVEVFLSIQMLKQNFWLPFHFAPGVVAMFVCLDKNRQK